MFLYQSFLQGLAKSILGYVLALSGDATFPEISDRKKELPEIRKWKIERCNSVSRFDQKGLKGLGEKENLSNIPLLKNKIAIHAIL